MGLRISTTERSRIAGLTMTRPMAVIRLVTGAQARRIARTEIAVDVAMRQTGIFDGAFCGFSMELCDRFVGCFSSGMFVCTDDVSFVSYGHWKYLSKVKKN